MKLLDCTKDILLEYIPKTATPYDTEFYTTIELNWFITQHAMGRMTREANLEVLTLEEIQNMCDRATESIIKIAYDKRNSYVFRPGFEFQIRDVDNYLATLACVVEKHITTIEYWFRVGGLHIHKYVDVFLVRYQHGTIRPQESEVDDAQWIGIDDAIARASFQRERDALQNAKDILG